MPVAARVIIVVVCVAFVIGLVVFMARSFRRGGTGPPIFMPAWTKAGRLRTNRSYAKHGWAQPYDDEGNLLPSAKRVKQTAGQSRT